MAIGKSKKTKDLNILIVGCGKVGMTIIERLANEVSNISVIDTNATRIQNVTDTYDVLGIVGNGARLTTLMDAGLENADIFIAVTPSDELNLLCCLLAKKAADCEVIARIRTPDTVEEADYLKDKLGIAMIINPDQEAALSISRILYIPTALSVHPFAKGKAELVRIILPADNVLVGKKIMDLGRELSGEVLICAVEREGEVYIPDGKFQLELGDVVTFISPVRSGRDFLRKIGFHTRQVRNSILIGGGRTAYYLAKELQDQGITVTIIENSKQRCEELSTLLPRAIVINGDGTNTELLKEVGIEEAQSAVTLTGIDEENIMLSLHVLEMSDAKVVTKVNRNGFEQITKRLKLGSVVYPKYIASEAIVAFVRGKKAAMDSNVETMVHLFSDRVEAIEFKVKESSPVTDKPLYQIPLLDHLLVSCINRNGKIIIPGGNDKILPGDSVIVVTTHTGLNDIQDIIVKGE